MDKLTFSIKPVRQFLTESMEGLLSTSATGLQVEVT